MISFGFLQSAHCWARVQPSTQSAQKMHPQLENNIVFCTENNTPTDFSRVSLGIKNTGLFSTHTDAPDLDKLVINTQEKLVTLNTSELYGT